MYEEVVTHMHQPVEKLDKSSTLKKKVVKNENCSCGSLLEELWRTTEQSTIQGWDSGYQAWCLLAMVPLTGPQCSMAQKNESYK